MKRTIDIAHEIGLTDPLCFHRFQSGCRLYYAHVYVPNTHGERGKTFFYPSKRDRAFVVDRVVRHYGARLISSGTIRLRLDRFAHRGAD